MTEVLLLIAGAIGGFLVHAVTMKVSFKQRTIDNKIKVYDALITQWVRMRNFVYTHQNQNYSNKIIQEFDQIYGESQRYIGEAFLVCEDSDLTTDINNLNERIYRTQWHQLPQNQVDVTMEQIKTDAIVVISRMREDIRSSTRFEWQDFVHIFCGLFGSKKRN